VRLLLERGYDVAVVDDLSNGYRRNVPADILHEMNLSSGAALADLMRRKRFDAVIHFAAFIEAGESMRDPARFFRNNVGGSLSLLGAMVEAGVERMVFSSSAAVYGTPLATPIREDFPIQPVNPYGETKAMVERMLRWFDEIHRLRSVSLRYFNAAGADPEGRLGEEHNPESHLIPLALRAIVTGRPVTVFGDDYDTLDGSCIRDYIHVNDLAEAHILAVERLCGGGASDRFNVGTGTGRSVMEVIGAVEEATGMKVPYVVGPRRAGDPPSLVAAADKLRAALGWKPQYADLRIIVEHAWRFARKRGAIGT
jgi:UDP-glucose-4-epimerase GalE